MPVRVALLAFIVPVNVETPETDRVLVLTSLVVIPVTVATPADIADTERPVPKSIVPAAPTRL